MVAERQPVMEVPGTVTVNRWEALPPPPPHPPEGNSKTPSVKAVTIHDGKCLTFPANANRSHVRSKNGAEAGGEEMRANSKMLQTHCPRIVPLADGQRSQMSLRSQMPVTFRFAVVAVSAETRPGTRLSRGQYGSCRPMLAFNRAAIMLMLIILGSFAVK